MKTGDRVCISAGPYVYFGVDLRYTLGTIRYDGSSRVIIDWDGDPFNTPDNRWLVDALWGIEAMRLVVITSPEQQEQVWDQRRREEWAMQYL